MRNDWKDPSVPEWASFFDQEEYEEFIILVGKYFTEKKIQFTIEEGVVNAEGNGMGFGKMGLDNIARTCKQSPINEWETRIYGHFDALEKSRKFQDEIQTSKKSFEEMKKYVAVRLYNTSYLDQIGEEHFIYKRLANDLIAALVFDYPDSIQNMQDSDTEGWNKSHEELFQVGIDNVRSNYSLLLHENEMEDYTIYTLDSDHFFAGNLYFELEQLSTIDTSKGALVAFPHRHCAVMYPIKDMSMVKVLNQLFPIVFNMNNDGAGPITNSIYWYHKGKLMAIPYELDTDGLKVIPPAEFVEFMNKLTGK
jgi:hypothetical protein